MLILPYGTGNCLILELQREANFLFKLNLKNLLLLCVCVNGMYVSAHATEHVWESEDNLVESVLSNIYAGSGNQTTFRLGW